MDGSTFSTLFTVSLTAGIFCLVLAVVFFFVLDIPKVYIFKTGKGRKKTIKRMEEQNALTGRLREQEAPLPKKNKTKETGSRQAAAPAQAPVPPQAVENTNSYAGEQGTEVLGAGDTNVLSNDAATSVLGQTDYYGGETSLLNEETPNVQAGGRYVRTTGGRFDIVFNLEMVNSNEII